MKRKEFKETLFETLNNVVDGMSYDDKMILGEKKEEYIIMGNVRIYHQNF